MYFFSVEGKVVIESGEPTHCQLITVQIMLNAVWLSITSIRNVKKKRNLKDLSVQLNSINAF